jgi:hypothetical protein
MEYVVAVAVVALDVCLFVDAVRAMLGKDQGRHE